MKKGKLKLCLKEFDSVLLDKTLYKNINCSDFDIYLILIHFYLNKKTTKFKISADEILDFRGIKKIAQKGFNPSGYKKNVKEKISNSICYLAHINLIEMKKYEDFTFEIKMNENYLKTDKVKLPVKLLNYNPHKNSWHKDIGYFLSIYKQKKSKISILQIQKILKEIRKNYSFLAPNEIRERFENVMDDLAKDGIIENWYYKNIDEDMLNCKNWLWWWQKLSVKIDFEILVKPPCFLNF